MVIRQTVDNSRTSSLEASARHKVVVMDTRAGERPFFVQRGPKVWNSGKLLHKNNDLKRRTEMRLKALERSRSLNGLGH